MPDDLTAMLTEATALTRKMTRLAEHAPEPDRAAVMAWADSSAELAAALRTQDERILHLVR